MRPALVCGCTRNPSRSRAAISLRTVAEETSTPGVPVMWPEPTGWAVSMYSDTTAFRMAALRWSSPVASSGTESAPGRGPRRAAASVASGGPAFREAGGRRGGRSGRGGRGALMVLALDSTECYRRPPGLAGSTRESVLDAQGGDERLLGDVHAPDGLHALLAFFLALEELALAGDVPAVALGEHVLSLGLHRLPGDDAPADRGLDGDVEELAGDELAQLLGHAPPVGVRLGAVHHRREGVHRHVVDEQVHLDQVGALVPLGLVVEAGVSLGPRLELVEEVHHHLGER